MIYKLLNTFFLVLTLCIDIAVSCSCQNASFGCLERERQTLLKLKDSFKDPSHRLSSWKGNNCCIWKGVGCDVTNGHVVKLNLRAPPRFSTNSLTGMMREEMSSLVAHVVHPCLLELRYLEHLDLSGNDFRLIPIPQFFGSMRRLEYLNISNARFEGSVPNNLGNLTALRVLDLSNDEGASMDLRADNVQWIRNLTSLQHVNMSGIYLGETRNLFQVLNRLPSLLSLHLSDCGLNNSHLSWQWQSINSSFHRLRELDLGRNFFAGRVPSMIQNMTSLRFLDLSLSGFTSSIYESFGNVRNLLHLNIAGNGFSGIERGLLLILGNMCHLRSLDISSNQLQGNRIGNHLNLSKCFGHDLETLNLDYSQISGYMPDWLGMLGNLKHLHLAQNQLNGAIPESLGQLSNLETLDLSHNSFEGAISEVQFASLSKLKMLYIGTTALTIRIKSNWIPPFQLEYIGMESCKFGTQFPRWLQTQSKATTLLLPNASISGSLPKWIKDMNINTLDLSLNQITGSLPSFPSNLKFVDLSNNLISGSIPNSSCHVEALVALDLSKNNLSGNIPDCWRHHQEIELIDLSSNSLSGTIPSSVGHLDWLRWLDLNNNNLSGEVPLALKNCTSLRFLDLGQNAFSGNVPKWIGDGFVFLEVLRLRENKFIGSIPSQLCHLSNRLRILDLAENNLHGMIPRCFDNFTAMVLSPPNTQYGDTYKNMIGWEDEHLNEDIKGTHLEYTKTLQYLVSIDLSRNNLEGLIPEELTLLTGLTALNLSHNQLSGKIPGKIGELESLESLDLSVNQLSGLIPDSMSSITTLSALNLSYNFSGKIPKGNQLQTLVDPSIYASNPLLCGAPLLEKCLDDDEPHRDDEEDNGEESHPEKMWFYIVTMSGYATGFWGVVGVLIFKKSWRHAYFMFVDRSKDRLVLQTELKMASFRNMIEARNLHR